MKEKKTRWLSKPPTFSATAFLGGLLLKTDVIMVKTLFTQGFSNVIGYDSNSGEVKKKKKTEQNYVANTSLSIPL